VASEVLIGCCVVVKKSDHGGRSGQRLEGLAMGLVENNARGVISYNHGTFTGVSATTTPSAEESNSKHELYPVESHQLSDSIMCAQNRLLVETTPISIDTRYIQDVADNTETQLHMSRARH
jgi:hypothetical protein